jgi:hypothetical protein
MWVRVARFEGGTAEGLDAEVARTREQLEQGRSADPPPGLEGVRRVVEAIDRSRGSAIALIYCDTEEDLRKAHDALDAMSPSSEASGRRVSVDLYEIANDIDLT